MDNIKELNVSEDFTTESEPVLIVWKTVLFLVIGLISVPAPMVNLEDF